MRRRLLPVVLATLLGACLLAVPAAMAAPGVDAPVLAAAEEGEVGGPEPDLNNSNRPAVYEPPFLIHAANGLAVLMVGLPLLLGGLYYLMVQRPKQRSSSSS